MGKSKHYWIDSKGIAHETRQSLCVHVIEYSSYEKLKQDYDNLFTLYKKSCDIRDREKAKLDVAVEALEFYASKEPWTYVAEDFGNKSRKALAKIKEG